MDVDGSGKLNEREFRTALSAMQIVTDEEDLVKFIQALDKDGDDEIDYDEFFDAFSVVDIKTFEEHRETNTNTDKEELKHAAKQVRSEQMSNAATIATAKKRDK